MARRLRACREKAAVGKPAVTEKRSATTPQVSAAGKRRPKEDNDSADPLRKRLWQSPEAEIKNPSGSQAQAPLTRENLRLLDKMMGKPPGTDSNSRLSAETAETARTSATSTPPGFAIAAAKNGILLARRSKAPENVADMRQQLCASRKSASATQSMYGGYVDRVQTATNEATMVTDTANDLLKRYEREGYKKAYNQQFTGLPKNVGFNNGLSAPQPDFVEGLLAEEFEPFPIDTHMSGGRLFRGSSNSLSLPHIAGEWKGPGRSMEGARLQGSYDGAALLYGRQQALAYLDQPDPPGQAAITTFTTDGTSLNLFAHYAETLDGQTKYHQHPVKSFNLVESYESFKQGRRALRNAQDHARDQSRGLRDQLRQRWSQEQLRLHEIREQYHAVNGIASEIKAAQKRKGYPDGDGDARETTPPSQAKPKKTKTRGSRQATKPVAPSQRRRSSRLVGKGRV